MQRFQVSEERIKHNFEKIFKVLTTFDILFGFYLFSNKMSFAFYFNLKLIFFLLGRFNVLIKKFCF